MTGPQGDAELFRESQRSRDQLMFVAAQLAAIAEQLSGFVADLRREAEVRDERGRHGRRG